MPARPPSARAAVLTLLLAGLAGCGGTVSDKFPPACPRAGVLADAADLTRYRGGGHDLTDLVLDARITGVSGDCTRADRRQLDVTVTVGMQVVRGPAAAGQPLEVPFFVAVSQGGAVLDKQVYRLSPGFGPNADTVRLTSDPVTISLPIGPDRLGSAYDVVVGFQLTQDELATNRHRGPR